jgi:hypothetical protein
MIFPIVGVSGHGIIKGGFIMANNSKKWQVNEEVYLRFLGDVTVGDAESWTRTVIIRRDNSKDIPPVILKDSCLSWNYLDYDIIEKISYKNTFTRAEEKRYYFVAELWEYILSWLNKEHNISITAKNLGCEEGYGQGFRRMPQMWIEPDFLIIEQDGGMDI